jgi:hypothetical protein
MDRLKIASDWAERVSLEIFMVQISPTVQQILKK